MIKGILILHILITFLLIGIVLIQKSEGGALGMGGNNGGLMTTRGTANLLTRTTAVLAALFFVTTLSLALLFKGESKPKSLVDDLAATSKPIASPTVPAPQKPEPLKNIEASAATQKKTKAASKP